VSFKLTCGHCNTSSIMRVLQKHDKVYSEIDWRPYVLVSCDNCGHGSMITFHMNSGWAFNFKGYENKEVFDVLDLHEFQVFPDNSLTIPPHLPGVLEQVYGDAEFNFKSQRWKASAQLYLQALEFTCILLANDFDENSAELESEKKIDLTKRINDLGDNGSISSSLRLWAHQIRVIGQYHKHRYVEASKEDCSDIRTYVEMFLRYAVSMPKEIELRRTRIKSE
jgi:Domain of unknown function (DUF4145)